MANSLQLEIVPTVPNLDTIHLGSAPRNSMQTLSQGIAQSGETTSAKSVQGQSLSAPDSSWAEELQSQMSLAAQDQGQSSKSMASNSPVSDLPGRISTGASADQWTTPIATPASERSSISITDPVTKPIATPVRGPSSGPIKSTAPQPVGPAPAPVQGPIQMPVSGPVTVTGSGPAKGPVLGPYPANSEDSSNSLSYINIGQAKDESVTERVPSENGVNPLPVQSEASGLPSSLLAQTDIARLTSVSSSTATGGSKTGNANSNEKSAGKSASLPIAQQSTSSVPTNGPVDQASLTVPVIGSENTSITRQSAEHADHTTTGTQQNAATLSADSSAAFAGSGKITSAEFAVLKQSLHANQLGANAGTAVDPQKSNAEPVQSTENVNNTAFQSPVTQGGILSGKENSMSGASGNESLAVSVQAVSQTQANEIQKSAVTGQYKAAENALKSTSKASDVTAGVEHAQNPAPSPGVSATQTSGQSLAQAQGLMHSTTPTEMQSSITTSSINIATPSMPLATGHREVTTTTAGTPFDGIDNATSMQDSGWLRSSAHQVEAGYHDPTLGWVEVRANEGAGGVHATLTPASESAANSLGEHLAGIANYLSQRETPVAALSVTGASVQNGMTNSGLGADSGQQNDQNPAQADEQWSGSRVEMNTTSNAGNSATFAGSHSRNGEVDTRSFGVNSSVVTYGSSPTGNRISVMA